MISLQFLSLKLRNITTINNIFILKKFFTLLIICFFAISLFANDGHNLWLQNDNEQGAIYTHPSFSLRLLNHWDNPDGTCERGFAGRSIFWKANGMADLKTIDEYGRANASIGINGTVLNNVNAKPMMLSTKKLREVKRIADVLRPYGIRVFLSVNFASPKALGGLPTADPLDKRVSQWWVKKCREIFRMIPDFGGFLVKANSEGEPGPMDYGRTHVDGANMLADALMAAWRPDATATAISRSETRLRECTPQQPVVMWRAFVYSAKGGDRASQAVEEFMPYDGQFRDNVIIQIKNGPVDFQPREPLSPLFCSLKHTKMMIELQLTQEYTGESIHTCFMPFWDRQAIDALHRYAPAENIVGVAGVANIGDSRDWCGSVMTQANWYAFGRIAADTTLTKETIAREWLGKTFTTDPGFVEPMTRVLCASHEAVVKYMMPLGLHHIFAGGHHYGPEPWCNPDGWREDWKPRYYHKTDTIGIGFDRTIATGSKNTALYPQPLSSEYEDISRCPEQLLLWFHHVPWTHRMHNGETLWDALCHTYDDGVREAEAMSDTWNRMAQYVDSERFTAQKACFDRQAADAWWWRDACLLYFQQFSHLPLPLGCPQPRHTLQQLMDFHLDMDNYTRADTSKLP